MPSSPSQIGCLSALPDELLITILSLLPTHIAARTSVLCRRFRHLWKASPSVDLSITYDRFGGPLWKSSVSMANSALLSRTPSNPLLCLSIKIYTYTQLPLPCDLTDSFISSLIVHAHALGLRHLTICGFLSFSKFEDSESVNRSVFSIGTLESLSIGIDFTFPSQIAFTRLRNLSINFTTDNSTQFQRLLSELCCLEDLHLSVSAWVKNICLSSHSIKKLELFMKYIQNDSLGLSMPSLEFIYLKNYSRCENLLLIHGEIPLIRKAVITIRRLRQEHIAAVAQLLNFISHVEELSLDLEEYSRSDYPFCVLIEPGKEVPTFRNLKHLDMSIRFHECNFEAVVMMLHRSTALESLKLHHKSHDMYPVTRGKGNAWRSKLPRNRDGNYQYAWRSKLPRNRDGNYQYACFKNLHLGENREEFKKLLNKKCAPKRQRVGS